MFKEFKEFAMRGSVLDMAVGIIIGAAFGTIVRSLVDDVLMPPIGLLLGDVDFTNLFLVLKEGTAAAPYASLEQAKAVGAVTVNYGLFVNGVISFLIVAFAVFFVIRSVNRLRREEAPAPAPVSTKDCDFCYTAIPIKASRCPHCTSEVRVVQRA
jgi:large conductance mechanosensitive channel